MSGSNEEITNNAGPASSGEPSMEEILASIRRILKDEDAGGQTTPADVPEEEDVLVLDSSMAVKPPAPAEFGPAQDPEALATPDEMFAPMPAAPMPEAPMPEAPEPEAPLPAALELDAPLPEAPMQAAPMQAAPVQAAPVHLASAPSEPEFPPVENQPVDLPAAAPEPQMQEPAEPLILTDPGIGATAGEVFSPEEAGHVQPPDGLIGSAASEAASHAIGSLIRSISHERSVAIGRPGLTLEDLVREELRPLLKSWLDSNLPSLVDRIVRAEIQRVVERGSL